MVYMSDSKIYTLGGVAVTPHKPYNPLDLPPYTMRFKFLHDNDDPTTQTWETGVTWTRVSSSPNIWDCTYQNSDWSSLFENKFAYVSWETWNGEAEVLGANIYGVTRLQFLFSNCWLLKAVSLFDTYTVQMFNGMFDRSSVLTVPPFNTENATSLHAMFMSTQITSVPMFNTSNVINMSYMFAGCPMLESVPLFDTSKVWSMEKMLNGCKSLKPFRFRRVNKKCLSPTSTRLRSRLSKSIKKKVVRSVC